MYDTIKCRLYDPDFQLLEAKLTPGSRKSHHAKYLGRYKNIHFVNRDEVVYFYGSICHLIRGNNYSNPAFSEIKEVVDKFCEDLNINPEETELTRLDFAVNVGVENTFNSHLNRFGELPRWWTCRYPGTIYYRTGDKTLAIYDKVKELIEKNKRFPKELLNERIIRFEYRILQHLKKHLGLSYVTLENLFDKNLYNFLLDTVFGLYEKISKTPVLKGTPPPEICNFNRFMQYIAGLYLTEHPEFDLLEHIKTSYKAEFITKQQADRLKRQTREMLKNSYLQCPSPECDELDKNIKSIVETLRV